MMSASVDRAMRTGFNWEMGPFQLWDAAGVRQTVERMKAAGEPVSANVERLLAAGNAAGIAIRAGMLRSRQRRLSARLRSRRASRASPTSALRMASSSRIPGLAHRSRRRRRLPGTSLQEERHRRGHHPAGDRTLAAG